MFRKLLATDTSGATLTAWANELKLGPQHMMLGTLFCKYIKFGTYTFS